MDWKRELIDSLGESVPGGYHADGEPASEPTALAGLALLAHDEADFALSAADWLREQQAETGAVGVGPSRPTPRWPTSLAILLWQAAEAARPSRRYADAIRRAVDWTLDDRGLPNVRRPWVGHDTTLVGWSWAANTHSWLEPTAMFVLALKAAGKSRHPRTREAIRLLVDRQLPGGGCNYGNTIVLGQELLPHVQPTGLVMMALAGEDDDPRVEQSLAYLQRELSAETTTASLCYGLLGLAAHGRSPTDRFDALEQAYQRTRHQAPSTYKLALLALAATDPYPFTT